jgi:hypothetical protein
MLDPKTMSEQDRINYYQSKYVPFRNAVAEYLNRYTGVRLHGTAHNRFWYDLDMRPGQGNFSRQDQIAPVVAACLGILPTRLMSYTTPSKVYVVLAKNDVLHKVCIGYTGSIHSIGWEHILELADDVEKLL